MVLLGSVHFAASILLVLFIGTAAPSPVCECKVVLPWVVVLRGLEMLPAIVPPKL